MPHMAVMRVEVDDSHKIHADESMCRAELNALATIFIIFIAELREMAILLDYKMIQFC